MTPTSLPTTKGVTEALRRIASLRYAEDADVYDTLEEALSIADTALASLSPLPAPGEGEASAILRTIRSMFEVEYHDDGRIASVGHKSDGLRKMVAILDAALSTPAAGELAVKALHDQIDAAREFVKRHPALNLIDLAEFEAFLKVPAALAAALASSQQGEKA
ncbi:hypothetical protein FJ951_26840 [Mesorhizobium sp. B2-2-3]|uniref:hypothetical protein n=1 Tax=Mesorhizobium sp. B2-2-3 TaxID=2589963 RepID=UPI001127D93A|nr:hypothetical protein [Mesorhizobium sp. B2-2-3]TPM39329.1 hypothetical protein FJ951_26840 [Mesorhizobium sp. B2-2-3]